MTVGPPERSRGARVRRGAGWVPWAVRMRLAANRTLDWFLPQACLCCHCPVDPKRNDFLCQRCRSDVRVLPPPGCGCGRGEPPSPEERDSCDLCRELPVGMATVRSAFPYAGVAGDIVRTLKYRHRIEAGEALARLTLGALSGHLTALRDRRGLDLVVAVPMHWWRQLRRGANQAECIARPLADLLGIGFDAEAIRRARHTPPQARRAKASERLGNVAGAFAVPDPRRVAGRTILLVDDVMTTGATMATCASELARAGAREVHALTVTRAGVGGAPVPMEDIVPMG
ncbi:MAG: ComF family protein [Candidatus Sumerlaeia bacterium]|nr:ComF family protein [Candidatus Sumerlaeia bacterium]